MLKERTFHSEDDTEARIAYEHDGRCGVSIFKQVSAADRRRGELTRVDQREFPTFEEAFGFAMAIEVA